MALRLSIGLLRTAVRIAFAAMLSVSLVLLFSLWFLRQFFDELQPDIN